LHEQTGRRRGAIRTLVEAESLPITLMKAWPIPRITFWDKVLLLVFAAVLVLWLLPPSSGLGRGRLLVRLALYLTGSIVVARSLLYLFRAYVKLFLWRVRNRMVAVYIFVGLIPLLLVLTMVVLGLSLVSGPLSAFIVRARIEQRAASLQATAASLGWDVRAAEPEKRGEAVQAFLANTAQFFPRVMMRVDTPSRVFAQPSDLANEKLPQAMRGFQGVVERRGDLLLAASAQLGPESPSILLLVPMTDEYLHTLLPRLGALERRVPGPPLGPGRFQELARLLPPPAHPFDYVIPWVVEVPALSLGTGEIQLRSDLRLVTRPSAVARALFGEQSTASSGTLWFAGGVLGVLFGIALLVSLFVAVSLTRTLTRAVDEMHLGTERINVGDFSYRISTRGDDQLGALARSFNSMAASIETLIEESKERQRLQSELEIAREVQGQLFPRCAPHLNGLEVLGVCRAAESVSGDFFDYIELPPSRLALAFGDVAGKGIAAALVMATLHSLVRSQLSLLAQSHGEADVLLSTARLVGEVNRQLHITTSSNKFATLFFGSYDEGSGAFIYSNAGHLPPFLIRGSQASRLDVHGLVVGAFPQAAYSSSILQLQSGDLVVAFTDGITEPENAYGDEFGEQRLSEILVREAHRPAAEIIDAVMSEIDLWTGSPALQDDRTMLVLRRQ
jgi:sigma-B regulation protein RsbU (phosphoserine phosphatase)